MNSNENKPYLNIVVQPNEIYRFRANDDHPGQLSPRERYMLGQIKDHNMYSRGILSFSRNLGDAPFPTVELRNYREKAVIKVKLYQYDKDVEHILTVVALEEITGEYNWTSIKPCAEISEETGYTVCFRNLSIQQLSNKERKKIREAINLDIVRLRFSAHDFTSDEEICSIFSQPVYNNRDPTQDLRLKKQKRSDELVICRSSRTYGQASGGDDVMLFVEKINSKNKILYKYFAENVNLMVNFFEINSDGERIWETSAIILPQYVHHKYGIYFKTPPYKDANIKSEVKVYFELEYLSQRSQRRSFIYTPCESCNEHQPQQLAVSTINLASLLDEEITVPEVADGNQTSDDLETRTDDDLQTFFETEWSEKKAKDTPWIPPVPANMETEQLSVVINRIPDDLPILFEKLLHVFDFTPLLEFEGEEEEVDMWWYSDHVKPLPVNKYMLEQNGIRSANTAVHLRHGEEILIKQLLDDICNLKRKKLLELYEEMIDKLENLLKIKMSNGDSILHVLLTSHEASFKQLVELISCLGLNDLLKRKNELGQTILHHAVAHNMSDMITYLVEKGCDPQWRDNFGSSVIHHAVLCRTGLKPLLEATAKKCKNDRKRFEFIISYCEDTVGLRPVHKAVQTGCAESLSLLCAAGASVSDCTHDQQRRTPLYMAVRADRADLVRILLDHIPDEKTFHYICEEGHSYISLSFDKPSPLQVACARDDVTQDTMEIVKLLLERGADPTWTCCRREPAWRAARAHPALWELMRPYLQRHNLHIDVQLDSEDKTTDVQSASS